MILKSPKIKKIWLKKFCESHPSFIGEKIYQRSFQLKPIWKKWHFLTNNSLALSPPQVSFYLWRSCAGVQGSISSTFYACLFCTKVLHKAFLCLQWRLNFLLVQEYWRNCANKMSVKLTPGLNFINVLRAAFAPVGLLQ